MKSPHCLAWIVNTKARLFAALTVVIFICTLIVINHSQTRWGFTAVINDISQHVYSNILHADSKNHDNISSHSELNYANDSKNLELNSANVPLNFKLTRRLSPLASITQRIAFADPPLTKAQISEIYRTGAGLEKIEVDGIPSWREFGVSYVPHQLKKYAESNLADTLHSDYDLYIPYNHTLFFEGRDHKKVPASERKIILTRLAGMDNMDDLLPLKLCPEFPCVQTTNKSYSSLASAITFNALGMAGKAPKRSPHQIFIFYSYESFEPGRNKNAVFHQKESGWTNAFNWTMTHHVEADIFMPYGLVRKRPTLITKDYESILANKEKMVAIFVSHCDTFGKREDYIKELQKYIPVDVYGRCGPYKCVRNDDAECFQNVSQKYKFYLAFENALCDDYITEKFFKTIALDFIIIARGGNTYYKHTPKDIFINTADFDSPKALAERLKYLDRHDEEYMKMLQRKDQCFAAHEKYPHLCGRTVWVKYNWENVPLCEVCQRLWNIDLYSRIYADIGRWYSERVCLEPTDV